MPGIMNTTINLQSGFSFDYTNLVGQGKVSANDIIALTTRLEEAHQAIINMRTTGFVQGHLSKDGSPEQVLFTKLPYVIEGGINTPISIARLEEFGQSLRYNVDTVVSFGIGGSYLGNKVLFDTYCGEFWNYKQVDQRNGYPKLFFSGNNIDPRRTNELIEHLVSDALHKCGESEGKRYKITLIVISKSGSTIDTMATFMVVYEALKKYDSLIDVSVVAVTDPSTGIRETLLHRLAVEQGWQTFSAPDGVGGRYSVFSEVGLITAVCVGVDISTFLAGARSMDEACKSSDLWQNPALLNAVLKYLAAEKHGRHIEVFMPYGDYLKAIAEWYVQLVAESLGKRYDRDGNEVFYGRTPIVTVGTTDMHAQTQQHQDGKRDKVVQFVKITEWEPNLTIPNCFPGTQLENISAIPLGFALDVAREANAEALIRDNRFNATFVLPKLNAFHLGELLYLLALSVAYEAELANVDAFDQPGVEAYKKLMGPKLQEWKNNGCV